MPKSPFGIWIVSFAFDQFVKKNTLDTIHALWNALPFASRASSPKHTTLPHEMVWHIWTSFCVPPNGDCKFVNVYYNKNSSPYFKL